MATYETELGYAIRETLTGIEVKENDEFVCFLKGRTIAEYCHNGKFNSKQIEADIEMELSVDDLDN